MVLHEVDTAAEQLFQICYRCDVVVKLRGHLDEEVYIAPFVMLVPCDRTEQPHRRYAETLPKFLCMDSYGINVFLLRFHLIDISSQR